MRSPRFNGEALALRNYFGPDEVGQPKSESFHRLFLAIVLLQTSRTPLVKIWQLVLQHPANARRAHADGCLQVAVGSAPGFELQDRRDVRDVLAVFDFFAHGFKG